MVIEIAHPCPSSGSVTPLPLGLRLPLGQEDVGRVARGDQLDEASIERPRRPDHRGKITVLRRPVEPGHGPTALVTTIEIPPEPGDPPPIAWVGAASSLVGGAVVALVFSPMFAVLAAVSALSLLARSLAARVSNRRARKRRSAALIDGERRVRDGIGVWCEAEQRRRREIGRGSTDDELLAGAMPWQRSLTGDAALSFGLGRGSVEVAAPDHRIDEPQLAALVPATIALEAVPITVEVGPGEGLAIVGDRADVLGCARRSIVDALIAHGPSDLGLMVLTTPDRLRDWDWLKWMPSLVGSAIDATGADSLIGSIDDASPGPSSPSAELGRAHLVLIDGQEASGAGPLARLLAGRVSRARVIWIGELADAPAACASTASVAADDRVVVRSVMGDAPMFGEVHQIGIVAADRLARCLAPFDDPLLVEAGAGLPLDVGFDELVGDGSLRRISDWAVADRTRLCASIGVDLDGPVEIDLVADGPHALVAGTTGAGKSELLRTLMLGLAWRQPPELVSFVLVDFKGGGAFDVVADLPHTSAVVTDLDAASAERALRALRAELRSREERLRAAGVADIADIADIAGPAGATGAVREPLPRLVIAVDEFAALADELPDFLDGLVDVARRGRSLGVHLVLATQRPAGVVTGQIRANTNLRICLRVQDRADSIDVIDRPDAAMLPAVPGRAILNRGGAVTELQIGRVHGSASTAAAAPFVLHHALFEAEPALAAQLWSCAAGASVTGASRDEAAVSLEERISACRADAAWHPAPPWLDELESVDLAEVEAASACPSAGHRPIPLGWLDDPDHRARRPLAWDPAESGLLIVGADRADVERSIHVALGGVLARDAETHVYVFDGGGGLGELSDLDGVGAVVTPTEGARAVKLLRRLHERRASGPPVCVIVHRWSAVADGLDAEAGLDARVALERLVREGTDRGLSLIITGADERDVPARVAGRLGCRLIHRLATSTAYLAFDVRDRMVGSLGEREVVEPGSNRRGMIGSISRRELADRSMPAIRPQTIEVLGDRVDRGAIAHVGDGTAMVIGLDDDLDPALVPFDVDRPVVVLGHAGSGRTTAIETLLASLDGGAAPVVIDDGERLSSSDGQAAVATAKEAGRHLIIGATPASARGIGSWLAPLLDASTIILLNPSRGDGEACRVVVPDLRQAPVGRAIVIDRGRTSLVQVAA